MKVESEGQSDLLRDTAGVSDRIEFHLQILTPEQFPLFFVPLNEGLTLSSLEHIPSSRQVPEPGIGQGTRCIWNCSRGRNRVWDAELPNPTELLLENVHLKMTPRMFSFTKQNYKWNGQEIYDTYVRLQNNLKQFNLSNEKTIFYQTINILTSCNMHYYQMFETMKLMCCWTKM